tara:strand:+ start:1486 stop:1878 length:393 start_codon:yes stop_codon:yes gene_type:complete
MQESRGKFESQFFKLLSEDLAEENISVGGGALGAAAQGGAIFNPDTNITSKDTYAPKTAVKPTMLGGVQTRSGSTSKKNKDKKKKGIGGVFLTGEENEEMCPDACCGLPVTECTCGPDCEHCNCYEINNG